MQRIPILISLLLLSSLSFAQPLARFGRLEDVRSIVGSGDSLLLTTDGGLFIYRPSNPPLSKPIKSRELTADNSLRSTELQEDGTLWISTDRGTLYKRSLRGTITAYNDFALSGAKITTLYSHGRYLYVGSDQGLTLFDTRRGRVLYTAQSVANAQGVTVEDIIIVGDTLFMSWTKGTSSGIALFDSLQHNLSALTFTDPAQWLDGSSAITPVRGGLKTFLLDAATLYTFSGPTILYKNNFLTSSGDSLIYIAKKSLTDSLIGFVRKREADRYIANGVVQDIYSDGSTIYVAQATRGLSTVSLLKDSIAFEYKNLGGLKEPHPAFVFSTSKGEQWLLPSVAIGHFYDTLSNGTVDSSVAFPIANSVTAITNGFFTPFNNSAPGFGSLGDGTYFAGFTEGRSGKIYLGSNGSSIKVWDGHSWGLWSIDRKNQTKPTFSTNGVANWFKADGLATDSSGYIWSTIWHNRESESDIPALFVMSEDGQKYRYLFKQSMEDFPPHSLTVDSKGHILAICGTPPLYYDNTFYLLDGHKNPFTTSETSLILQQGKHPSRTSLITATPTSLGSILLGTNGGVDVYRYGTSGGFARLKNYPQKFQGTITALVAQQSRKVPGETYGTYGIETTLWAAGKDIAPTQMRIIETIDNQSDNLISARYDTSFTAHTLGEEDGFLVRDFSVNYSLSLDRTTNTLWIVDGAGGISSYGVPKSVTTTQDNSELKVYPNPYSHKSHNRIKIAAVTPGGFIDIYSSDGRVIAHLDQNSGDLIEEGALEWVYQWRIPTHIAPGIYYIVAKGVDGTTSVNRSTTTTRKLIIIP